MRIGVLTYYHDMNCGTTLQAYATLLAVKRVFPEATVEIIPFRAFRLRRLPYKHCATISSLLRDARRILGYIYFAKKYQGIKKDFVTSNPVEGVKYIESLGYDRIYVGADTLLELDRLPKGYVGLSAFWLSPDISAKKYLLAASSKNVSYAHLTEQQKKEMKRCVDSYSGMMVRDKATFELLSHFTDKDNIQTISDPTFTLPIDFSFADRYVKRRGIDFSNVICFHPIKGETWCKEVAERLRAEGYKIASFRPEKWADYELNDMTPFEQLGIYSQFKCFVTHRFHDTVFCLKNNARVVTYPASDKYSAINGGSKYSALYDLFGLTDLCFIQKKSEITPDMMMEKIHTVINRFDNFKSKIDEVINFLGTEYIKKLEATK